jgi:hypothetical protein
MVLARETSNTISMHISRIGHSLRACRGSQSIPDRSTLLSIDRTDDCMIREHTWRTEAIAAGEQLQEPLQTPT